LVAVHSSPTTFIGAESSATYAGQAALPGGSLYHASKWGIEGFIDSVAQEVAPFYIGVTIVEPGGARTDFRYRSAKVGLKMDAYSDTPALCCCGGTG
jgi:NAD(P)-dependent dehydrogenase (short-subunit alcohol dehydrogenase family)